MRTGYQGTFVISWGQTDLDGVLAPPIEALTIGASWRWTGEAVRVDGPQDVLILTGAEGEAEMRRRAARTVRRLLGAAMEGRAFSDLEDDPGLPEQGFTVTDGHQAWVVGVVETPDLAARLLVFTGQVPPVNADLWVVDRMVELRPAPAGPEGAGVICFTPGTLIDTPEGRRPVEALRPGDRVQTRDDGAQDILWVGSRRMTGARLYALPHLRPVRIRSGALGLGRPEGDLLVSPQHRMLIRGPAARALFNEPEVLVQAMDLVNGASVRIEQGLPEVTYIHLLFARHQVLCANGLDSESFHPAGTALGMVAEDQRAGLLSIFPDLARDPLSYGAFARRALQPAEAAILRHDLVA